jgi:hypothetical protein
MVPPYGSDITEALPMPLSNPSGNQAYAASGISFDVALAGQPFFLNNTDETPYRRVTAQYRKNQLDTTREPGEQTLTGWWLRSQSTFHLGQGIKFFEPAQDESLRFQYTWSKGCNVWNKGQVTLLHDVTTTHLTTGDLQPNKRPFQIERSVRPSWTVTNKALTSNVATLTIGSHKLTAGATVNIDNIDETFNGTYVLTAVGATTISYAKTASNVTSVAASGLVTQDCILLWDKYDVDRIDVGGHLIHFVDYNAGTDDPVYAICDDGTFAYWVTNKTSGGANKMHVYKKALKDDASVSPTLMFDATGIVVTNAVIEFTKERLVLAANNKVYEFATTATALPSPVYTHPTDNFVYTSITSSGAAIYLAGYTGIQSTVQKFTLNTSGAMPTLTSAITAAELPVGEIAFRIYYYLGYMAIGTSLGLRIAQVSDQDGSVAYGPLLFESEQPVYDVAGYDKYLWCTTNVDGNPGVSRVDLSTPIGTSLVFAYAWDLYDPATTGFTTTSCSFLGNTNLLAFCTANNGSENGKIYLESATVLVPQGSMRTGYIRYNTLENKIFKFLTPRFNTLNGGISIQSIDQNDNSYNLGVFTQGSDLSQVGISYPNGAQQFLGFQFTFTRSSLDDTKGPIFTGYQVNTLPSIPRQRLIQYPISMYDHEMDKFGNQTGYEGYVYDRLQTMQNIEDIGDLIKVEDFRTNETYLGLIEEMDFINKTPTDKRYSGFGGLLLITIRTA